MIEQQDYIDFNYVPQSRGIGRGTIVILAIGVLMIFAIGGFTAFLSGYGHMWPYTATERENLHQMPSPIQ
jgi:hypothetical protein